MADITDIDTGSGLRADGTGSADNATDVVIYPASDSVFSPVDKTASNDVVTLPDENKDADAPKLPTGAVLSDDGSVRLPLKYVVKIRFKQGENGEIRDELTTDLVLHRLKGTGMTQINEAPKGQSIVTALAVSAQMPVHKMQAIYDRMDGADILAAAQVIDFFLPSGPKTGR